MTTHDTKAPRRPLVIGHRGNAAEAPENTLAGFEQAIRLGVDLIEVDVRCTRDDAIVLIHNETVDDSTDGTGVVAEMTLDEIRRLDAGAHRGAAFRGERVPTLREALDPARGHVLLNLDVKDARAIPAMVAAVRDARMLDQVVVTGCTEGWAALVHAEERRLPVLLNADEPLTELAKRDVDAFVLEAVYRAIGAGLRALNFSHKLVGAPLVEAAHRRGVAVWTWTVDEPVRMKELIAIDVDAITTNVPRRLLAVRDGAEILERTDGT